MANCAYFSGRILQAAGEVSQRPQAALIPHPRAQRLPQEPGPAGRCYRGLGPQRGRPPHGLRAVQAAGQQEAAQTQAERTRVHRHRGGGQEQEHS